MKRKEFNTYMIDLAGRLIEDRDVSEKTAFKYVKDLYRINDEEMFTSLRFLKDIETVLSKIADKSTNTQKAYIGSILGVLALYKASPKYKKTADKYNKILSEMRGEYDEKTENNEKTDTQAKNWVSWEEVIKKRQALYDEVDKFISNKTLKTKQYNKLLQLVVLSLYTYQAPRRNEYSLMEIVQADNSKTNDKEKNYLILKTKQFVFNNYKTQKKYGQQVIDIHDSLWVIINKYLRHHPLYKKGKSNVPFLVNEDGQQVNSTNGITRILNRIFAPHKVGASMLRHIYLSHKYGDQYSDKQDTAEAMGHSVSTQKDYIKTDGKDSEDSKDE